MNGKIRYEFSAKVWRQVSTGSWHFIALPIEQSNEIRQHLKWQEEGWGRLKAVAHIGSSKWDTAIWFDTKRNTYLLPIKAEIRRKERIEPDKQINAAVWV